MMAQHVYWRSFVDLLKLLKFVVVVVEIVFTVVVEVEVEVAAEMFCIVSSRVESNGELQIGYIYNIFIYWHSISFNYMHTINT